MEEEKVAQLIAEGIRQAKQVQPKKKKQAPPEPTSFIALGSLVVKRGLVTWARKSGSKEILVAVASTNSFERAMFDTTEERDASWEVLMASLGVKKPEGTNKSEQ